MNQEVVKGLLDVQKGQGANLERVTAMVGALNARVLAQQAALYALIATHPDPKALFDQFATLLDSAAPEFGEQPMPLLPEEMQRLQEKIRQAASGRPR